jgi:hypothetical protein
MIVAVEPAVAGDQAVESEPGAVADIARCDDIGRAEGAGKAMGVAIVSSAGALRHGDGGSPEFFLCLLDFRTDRIERLIPGDSFPFSLSLGPSPFQGVLETIGVVHMLDTRQTLGAHGPFGEGVGVALDVDNGPVFHGHLHAATAVTADAGCTDYLPF